MILLPVLDETQQHQDLLLTVYDSGKGTGQLTYMPRISLVCTAGDQAPSIAPFVIKEVAHSHHSMLITYLQMWNPVAK
jgi:predicted Abi (CAAX) family protease